MRPLAIAALMTRTPVCARPDEKLIVAGDRMAGRRIRHLPVVDDDGRIVGVISARDIETLSRCPVVAPSKGLVADAMAPAAYVVRQTALVTEVVETMAKKSYGCAVIVDARGRPRGIFTTVDALSAIGRLGLKAPRRPKGRRHVS